jgi:hypothetical protein
VNILFARTARINHVKNQIGLFQLNAGTSNTFLFKAIARLARAGSINQSHGNAVEVDRILDSITGCTGDFADYCAVVAKQQI